MSDFGRDDNEPANEAAFKDDEVNDYHEPKEPVGGEDQSGAGEGDGANQENVVVLGDASALTSQSHAMAARKSDKDKRIPISCGVSSRG
jgi:hypothetical protein